MCKIGDIIAIKNFDEELDLEDYVYDEGLVR